MTFIDLNHLVCGKLDAELLVVVLACDCGDTDPRQDRTHAFVGVTTFQDLLYILVVGQPSGVLRSRVMTMAGMALVLCTQTPAWSTK